MPLTKQFIDKYTFVAGAPRVVDGQPVDEMSREELIALTGFLSEERFEECRQHKKELMCLLDRLCKIPIWIQCLFGAHG